MKGLVAGAATGNDAHLSFGFRFGLLLGRIELTFTDRRVPARSLPVIRLRRRVHHY